MPIGVDPPAPPALDPRAYRALGGSSRARMLEVLRGSGPLEIDELAERTGLHVNTVRAHLAVLRKAGMVTARRLPSAGRGRPRLAFATTDLLPDEAHPGAYRVLARVLTEALRGREDGPERAAAAGYAAGRELVEEASDGAPTEEERRARVVELLDRLGFAPRPRPEEAPEAAAVVMLERCPFADLAADSAPIVCSVHDGLLHGAFEKLGGAPDGLRLVPFAAPRTCTVAFERR